MRAPTWRGAETGSDWGLPPLRRRDLVLRPWAEAASSAGASLRHLTEVRRLRRRVLQSSEPPRLSIGCGRKPPEGWLGIDMRWRQADIFRCDLRAGIPVPDSSLSAILAEHVFEHFPLDDVPTLLAECRRVLAPGGVLRAVSPDALFIARMIASPNEAVVKHGINNDAAIHGWPPSVHPMRVANRSSHQWG